MNDPAARIGPLAVELGEVLSMSNMMLATAESCTGGWIAKAVTDVAGSSKWFERGFVTYTNESKIDLLGVSSATLEAFGAVSEQVASEMVKGALLHSRADVAVSVSGIAGPGGGTESKPVGTVWIAWQRNGQQANAQRFQFQGDREQVRIQAVVAALSGVIERCRT